MARTTVQMTVSVHKEERDMIAELKKNGVNISFLVRQAIQEAHANMTPLYSKNKESK